MDASPHHPPAPTALAPPADRPERGQATAEYAVCTVGAVAIAVLIDQLLTDGTILDLLRALFSQGFGEPWGGLLDGRPFTPLRVR